MIDARFVIVSGLWILPAAALLAAFSLDHWTRSRRALARTGPEPRRGAVARIAAAEPFVVMAIAPLLLFPSPARCAVALAVAVVWWCNRRVSGHLIPPTPLNLCVLLLLGATAVSMFATFDVRVSLGKVAGVGLGALVFWTMARWTTTETRVAVAAGGFLLVGGALAVLGLLGTNWFGKFPMLASVIDRLPRAIRGVPGAEEGFHPNAVAGCLVLFIPLQVALLTGAGRRALLSMLPGGNRGLIVGAQGVLLALTSGTLLLTQSRGAWAGLVAAGLAFLAWHSRRTRLLAAAILASLVVAAFVLSPGRLADLAISRSGPEMARNVSGRVELWSRAVYAIQDFPLTGMGMNVYRKVMPRLYPTLHSTPDFDVSHAHNHLLQAALDLGIPGLVAYLAIWLSVGTLLVRVYRRGSGPGARILAGGLGAGLLAHFAFSLTDAIPLGAKVGVLFWMTLGLAVSLRQLLVELPAAAPGHDRNVPQP